jgi:hypothetical protein
MGDARIITVRTTVNIDDQLLDWAKEVARSRDVTLGDLLVEALHHLLSHPLEKVGPELPVFQGEDLGMLPGIDPSSNQSMFDAADDLGDLHA